MSPDLHHLSGAYAVDALDDAERAEFEQHLAVCASCRAEVAELTDTAHALGALSEATPPPHLRDAVLGGIARVRPLPPLLSEEQQEEGEDGDGDATVVPFIRRTSTWLATAAAVILLAVGGLVWHPWSADDGTLTAVDQVRRAQDATTVTSQKGDLSATLAYSRQLDRSALTVTGLPPVPSGKTYQLWYIGSQGARSAGFLEATDGRGSAVLEGQIDGAGQVGVTVEPAGGSPAPTTDPVLVMSLT
jgi:anti-sigma-K factor RskA